MGSGGRSVASDYPGGEESCCNKCITRVPYATLIALILNWAGVGVFCGTLYRWGAVNSLAYVTRDAFVHCRGVNLTLRMLQDVFQLDKGLGWVEPTQLAFIILGASMAALALMILVVAILATGATRHEVYQTSGGRAGGRIGKCNNTRRAQQP